MRATPYSDYAVTLKPGARINGYRGMDFEIRHREATGWVLVNAGWTAGGRRDAKKATDELIAEREAKRKAD